MSVALPTQPTGTSLARLGELAVERHGDQNTLVFEGTTWTGTQLAARARRLCGGLLEAGLAPGERVVVCMANCPEVGISYSAIWRAGAVATPVVFLLSEDELRHVFTDSGATFVLTTPEFLPKVSSAALGVATIRALIVVGDAPATGAGVPVLSFADLEDSDEADLVERDSSELAALLYTGGTTGRSKGVMLSSDALSAAAWGATVSTHEAEHRTVLLPLPLSHAYGLLVTVMGLHNPDPATTVLMRWFIPGDWLRLAQEHRVQAAPVVPSMLQMLLQLDLESADLSELRRVTSGGAALSREVADAFTKRLPHVEVAEGYGCTETAAIIATSPPSEVRSGSVGRPAPGVELRIEPRDGDEGREGESAPTGVDGEICVRGAMLMDGYWHSPDETAQVLRGGWLHTGDIGHLDDDGYLYVVDRIKDLVIRGGFNIYPRDVEDVLLGHPDVVAAAVVGRPDPTYGEEVVGFVQLRPGAAATPLELVQYAKEHLAAHKYPREVQIVDAVPLTSVGKTDRKALRGRVTST